jgi:NitT/TauT family transport system substrate-binding protein
MAKAQTTGFEEHILWQAIYGRRSSGRGEELRLQLPFGFTDASREHIRRATAFLHEIKSIDVPELPADAIVSRFTDDILRERGSNEPVGQVFAQNDPYQK